MMNMTILSQQICGGTSLDGDISADFIYDVIKRSLWRRLSSSSHTGMLHFRSKLISRQRPVHSDAGPSADFICTCK